MMRLRLRCNQTTPKLLLARVVNLHTVCTQLVTSRLCRTCSPKDMYDDDNGFDEVLNQRSLCMKDEVRMEPLSHLNWPVIRRTRLVFCGTTCAIKNPAIARPNQGQGAHGQSLDPYMYVCRSFCGGQSGRSVIPDILNQ